MSWDVKYPELAKTLLAAKQGTFTSLEIAKKGIVRDGKHFNNDRVRVTMVTGFKYQELLRKSIHALDQVNPMSIVQQKLFGWVRVPLEDQVSHGVSQELVEEVIQEYGLEDSERPFLKASYREGWEVRPVDYDAVCEAIGKIQKGIELSLRGENRSSCEHVFKSLEGRRGGKTKDPKPSRGVKVYTGSEASPTGTIYVDGLKIDEKVLKPAPQWKPHSSPVTVARVFIEEMLPKGRYVRFELDPQRDDFKLNVGGASFISSEGGCLISPQETTRTL